MAKVAFSVISVGTDHSCGVEKGNGKAHCWGTPNTAIYRQGTPNVHFTTISTGSDHQCGIEEGSGKAYCWGSDTGQKGNVVGKTSKIPKGVQFSSISASKSFTCGLEKGTGKCHCWGGDLNGVLSNMPKDVQFSSISASTHGDHVCGVEKETNIPRCWGTDNSYSQSTVPNKGIKWTLEASCQTEHPEVSGPVACTSCNSKGCNPHFTIIDPKTNTGTCTKKKCPTCKPKACCSKGHKHYVLNSKNLEGVCVRHSDDCTPVCVPFGSDDPKERRICTKGCNRLLKSLKSKEATREREMYDIVTCQADKQVICDPAGESESSCRMESSYKAQAVCSFSPEIWNLGATCITNHVEGEKYPQCPDGTSAKSIASIKANCKEASEGDDVKCSRLGMSY